ncbi:MAG: class I SAM-dependent methyltransferase [Bacteroidetes bacterium]|nr:class I SAM-dependent methyltransferase [Bacteroidota bacterium]
MTWRIWKYIQHLFYWSHRKGHGIHSPYLFEFVNGVIFNGSKVKVPGEILLQHRELKRDKSIIPVGKLGATSNVDSSGERSVGSFVRDSSVTEKYGALLHRICRWNEPEIVIELGSGLGVSTLYLASGSPEVPLHSIEGNTDRASFAAQLICRNKLGSTSVHWGEMSEKLEDLIPLIKGRFVAFVDGNHRYEPTLIYLRRLVDTGVGESVIIMDDIYWSKEMFAAWREVISWPEVMVSIDLYQMGLLLLRSDLAKGDYKIKF